MVLQLLFIELLCSIAKYLQVWTPIGRYILLHVYYVDGHKKRGKECYRIWYIGVHIYPAIDLNNNKKVCIVIYLLFENHDVGPQKMNS